ncbi:MAG TPA: ATP-binding protein [Terracidiphilus sp.]
MPTFESCFSEVELDRIFVFEARANKHLISRENSRLEFKETFNLGSADDYAKTAAAFANAQGGYIVFGVKDSPRELTGLKSNNFETFDTAKLTNALNERFSPEIQWECHVAQVRGLKVGMLYFAEAQQKPVVCTKGGGVLQLASIYYRYRGRSEAIRYPELRRILDEEKARERSLWMKQLRKISEFGIDNAAVLDLQSGEVSGANGRFYISEDLLPKIRFIREGRLADSEGAPALRLIGDVRTAEGPLRHSTVQVPKPIHESEIIAAFLNRESLLSPLEYLKAICFEQSYFLPVYFFIQQTDETIPGTIQILRSLEVRGNTRNKLIERLEKPQESLTCGKLTSPSTAAIDRRGILNQLRSKSLPPETITTNPVRFFEALTHTSADEFDQTYIFSLLVQHVLPTLSQLNGLPRTAFRKALCHLDLIWCRPSVT